jgi:cytoskeletal protein CcmA (bactofilin family)
MPKTVIGAGTQIESGLRATDDLQIDGQVDGAVLGEAAVVLSAGAQVGGDVRGREVTIGCVLRHDVHATHAVHLLSTAEVYGLITAPRITVDDGAVLEGQIKITRAAPTQVPAQSQSNERRAPESRMRQIAAAAAAPSGPRAIPELPMLGRRVATRRKA